MSNDSALAPGAAYGNVATDAGISSTETVGAYEPPTQTYDDVFPPLGGDEPAPPISAVGTPIPQPIMPTIGPSYANMALKSSSITQVFHVPLEERRFKEIDEGFGESGGQSAKICGDIMMKTGAAIEISRARDQSLTIVVTGKQDAVMKARRELMNRLQTQANVTVNIPKDHHRYIIGKKGEKLRDLELATATKITIPNQGENSDFIHIVGTKEGIDRARHEVQLISEEQAKKAFERLNIPRVYHPFICGPNNKFTRDLIARTGAKINVPPPSVHKDEIVVSGEKEGVHEAIDVIMRIYEDKKQKTTTVSLEVLKGQHKYVIGPRGSNITEILEATGVSVEMPPLESPSETITLRGEQDKLGPAITMVYSKASSVVVKDVQAPAWLHRFIIGRQGKNIRSMTQNLPKVHVEFEEGKDKIHLEGPPEEVEQARLALEEMTHDLVSRLDFAVIKIEQKFHKHIIGKSGANVNRIKKATGVLIHIPNDDQRSDEIRIEGSPEGVQQAKEELMEMALRMENERSRDILIEHRFHRTIIGTKGENIRDIREKFNKCQITFPDPGKKSDVVTLRGPKQDVDKCYKFLTQLNAELVSKNYQINLPIFKKFHKNIIGKGGSTINKIKEDTDTRIEIPTENSTSDIIVITGEKDKAEKAKQKILSIQNELANITEVEVTILAKHHQGLIGAKGRLVRAIMEECGGVYIHFPNEGSNSDKVTIRGPKDEVEKAKKQLLELANEREQASFTMDVHAKPEYHKFLIGRGGANIRNVRQETGARVVFPTLKDEDQTLITIVGTKQSVEQAKQKLQTLIKDLENITETEINVDPKYHRHFVARRGQVLREIADEYGGVTVSFPRNGSTSERVTIKGAKDCVEAAKNRILDIVEDLESQVTIECIIEQKHHRTVMGAKGLKVQGITSKYDVGIKFPDRNPNQLPPRQQQQQQQQDGASSPPPSSPPRENGNVVNGDATNGDLHSSEDEKPKKQDIIIITGKKENCENAKADLLALVPVTAEVDVPFDYHRFVIGQKGAGVRRMMEEFDVNISIPPAMRQSNIVTVTGTSDNVKAAVQGLQHRVEELDKEQEDRRLRSFSLEVTVDQKYHPKIIGRKGAVISVIRTDHDVNIQFPNQNAPNQEVITITGYEKNAEAARDAILQIVEELENQVSIDCDIDHRVHNRLIGSRGRYIRDIMKKFKVDVKFPRPSDPNPNLVTISGDEDACYDCKDELLNLEEEFLQDVTEEEDLKRYEAPRRQAEPKPQTSYPGFAGMQGAPWNKDAPDTNNISDFPSIGAATTAPTVSHAWGPSSKR